MSTIISIETSESVCSVAVGVDGRQTFYIEDTTERNHARVLTSFLSQALDHCKQHNSEPQAIAVSMGPGSYTGLRIGLSEAKGLAYALNIPIIGLSTLKIIANHVASSGKYPIDAIYVPMIDARRMEVYMAAYVADMQNPCELKQIVKPAPQIIDDLALAGLRGDFRPKIYFGSGSQKSFPIVGEPGDTLVTDIVPKASMMCQLAFDEFVNGNFLNIAYSTPEYLKDFYATTPKNKVFGK